MIVVPISEAIIARSNLAARMRFSSAAQSLIVQANNQTLAPLNMTYKHLDHGEWVADPDQVISAGAAMVAATQSATFGGSVSLSGTEGRVTFAVPSLFGATMSLELYWNLPYIGDTVYETLVTGSNAGSYIASLSSEKLRVALNKEIDYVQSNLQTLLMAGQPVRYGSIIRLRHLLSYRALRSSNRKYMHSGSSKQLQVGATQVIIPAPPPVPVGGIVGLAFAFWAEERWRVKGPDGQPDNFRLGEPVKSGDVLRFQNLRTGSNLHSHAGFPSPATKQQEVTCFGQNGIGDTNDNWRIEIEGGEGKTWDVGQRIRLIHVLTNHVLHSHRSLYVVYFDSIKPVFQQEVTCFPGRDDNDWWAAFEVYT